MWIVVVLVLVGISEVVLLVVRVLDVELLVLRSQGVLSKVKTVRSSPHLNIDLDAPDHVYVTHSGYVEVMLERLR